MGHWTTWKITDNLTTLSLVLSNGRQGKGKDGVHESLKAYGWHWISLQTNKQTKKKLIEKRLITQPVDFSNIPSWYLHLLLLSSKLGETMQTSQSLFTSWRHQIRSCASFHEGDSLPGLAWESGRRKDPGSMNLRFDSRSYSTLDLLRAAIFYSDWICGK